MDQTSALQEANKIFEKYGLEVHFYKKTEKVPFDISLVSLGEDEKTRPLMMQVQQSTEKILEPFVKKQEKEEAPILPNSLQMLTFLLTLPFEIPTSTAYEAVRLSLIANKSLPLGAFNYSEPEKAIYFSYSFPIFNNPLDELTVMLIVNTFLFARKTFFHAIEDVACGKETVESLLQSDIRSSS
jgi:hypothetical protein